MARTRGRYRGPPILHFKPDDGPLKGETLRAPASADAFPPGTEFEAAGQNRAAGRFETHRFQVVRVERASGFLNDGPTIVVRWVGFVGLPPTPTDGASIRPPGQ